MAEPTIRDLIKLLKQEAQETAIDNDNLLRATNDVKDEVASLTKLLSKYFLAQKAAEGDKLEKEREKRQVKDQQQRQKAKSSGNGFNLGLLGLGAGGLMGMIAPLTGGLAALGGAFAGLRGWEIGAIKSLGKIDLVPLAVSNGVIRIRNAAFKIFGLTPEGILSRDALGRFTKTPPINEQIRMKMNALRLRVLKVFGIGADGKLLTLKDPDGLFKRNIIGRVTFQVGRLLKPLMNVADGIAKFATGAGKPLFNFIRSIGAMGIGNLGKIAGVFGTILRPIGFIFSFKAAYDEFVNSEKGTLLEKSTDAIGAFFGDFIGAPLELVKSLVARLFGLIGWDAAAKKLTDFNIENMLTEAFQTILDAPRAIITYLGKLFTDEEFKAEQLAKLKNTITNWGSSLVGWIGSILPDFSGLTDWIKSQAKEYLPEAVYDYMFPRKMPAEKLEGKDGNLGKSFDTLSGMIDQIAITKEAQRFALAKYAGDDSILTAKEFNKARQTKGNELEIAKALMEYNKITNSNLSTNQLYNQLKNQGPLDLRGPVGGTSGANATVIDNSSRNSNTNNTGLLLNSGAAVDNFQPYGGGR